MKGKRAHTVVKDDMVTHMDIRPQGAPFNGPEKDRTALETEELIRGIAGVHRMADEDVLRHIRDDTLLNKLRTVFSAESARIEQATQQFRPVGIIELRRMEFEAVRKIATVLGVQI